MGNKKKSNYQGFQSARGGRMVGLYFDMLESKAWAELSALDKELYIEMLKKYSAKYVKGNLVSSNKDDISMPKADYLKLMTQRSFEKSIDHLIELGFVRVVENRYATRECTIYGFIDMWQHYGTSKFCIKDEWRRLKKREEGL